MFVAPGAAMWEGSKRGAYPTDALSEGAHGPGKASRGIGRKLLEEAAEFFSDPSSEEAADVLMVILAIAYREGWNLPSAINKKFDIVSGRNQKSRDSTRPLKEEA